MGSRLNIVTRMPNQAAMPTLLRLRVVSGGNAPTTVWLIICSNSGSPSLKPNPTCELATTSDVE